MKSFFSFTAVATLKMGDYFKQFSKTDFWEEYY